MSKFKNKKALALSVGAIMAGVSVIGVVAACAPTKAKPAKPTEKKVEQPQNGGTDSSKQGSGSTTNDTKQGSETGGTTNSSGGSDNTTKGTTQPSTPQNPQVTNPGAGSNKDKGSTTESTKPENPDNQGKQNSNGGSTSKNDKEAMQGDNPGAGNGTEAGKQGNPGANAETGKEGKTDAETNGSQNGESTDNAKNKELDAKKKDVKDKIAKLASLSADEIQKFKDEVDAIDDPKDIAKVDDVLKAAEQKAADKKAADKKALEDLETKKNETKDEIGKLISLSSEDIQKFKDEVDAIKNPNEITKVDEVLTRAKEEALKQLKVKKDDAKQEIGKLEHLSAEQIKEYNSKVDAVADPKEANKVDEALNAAKEKNREIQLSKFKVKHLQFENTTTQHQGKEIKVKQLHLYITGEDKFIKEIANVPTATITLKSSTEPKTNLVFKFTTPGVYFDTKDEIEVIKPFALTDEKQYTIDTIEIFDGKKTWLANLEGKKLTFVPKTYNNSLYKFS
ncbi:GA module-containing protein [Ureaplasma diversum]|uniref:Protein G-related albumin-binding (GA) module domain-containing protein n=1 Tax=Ureaplasma diversum NCTC 246 TaxID=1188241 RepID=A0A084F063_9BACT|nr:GA module-containing protein [Ureaplasma diversum]KEZ23605.1 Hypothetical protein, predicted lipoprotein [Ureaplasma diversum NCTC 246]